MLKSKRYAVAVILAGMFGLMGSNASAWSPVASDADGNQYLIDAEGMTRKGYVVYVWQLANLAQRDERGAMSVRSQMEFDCRFKQSRVMWQTLHTELNEGGTTLGSAAVSNPQWIPAPPGGTSEMLIDYACRRIMR